MLYVIILYAFIGMEIGIFRGILMCKVQNSEITKKSRYFKLFVSNLICGIFIWPIIWYWDSVDAGT